MRNVEIEVDSKGIMIIKVDTKKDFGPSKSGKTIVIATTQGNVPEGGMYVGLNVYRFAKSKE